MSVPDAVCSRLAFMLGARPVAERSVADAEL